MPSNTSDAYNSIFGAGNNFSAQGGQPAQPNSNSYQAIFGANTNFPKPSQPVQQPQQVPQVTQPQQQPQNTLQNVTGFLGNAFNNVKQSVSSFGANVQKQGIAGVFADAITPADKKQPQAVIDQNMETFMTSPKSGEITAKIGLDATFQELNRLSTNGAALTALTNSDNLDPYSLKQLQDYGYLDEQGKIKKGKFAIEQVKTLFDFSLFVPEIFLPLNLLTKGATGGAVFNIAGKAVPIAQLVDGAVIGGMFSTIYTPGLENIMSDPAVADEAIKNFVIGAGIGTVLSFPLAYINAPASVKKISPENLIKAKELYVSLAKKYHPDSHVMGNESAFKTIKTKYDQADLEWLNKLNNATPAEAEKLLGIKLPNKEVATKFLEAKPESAKTIQQKVQMPDLTKYENAMQAEDLKTVFEIAKKYPNDARFQVHTTVGYTEADIVKVVPKVEANIVKPVPQVLTTGTEDVILYKGLNLGRKLSQIPYEKGVSFYTTDKSTATDYSTAQEDDRVLELNKKKQELEASITNETVPSDRTKIQNEILDINKQVKDIQVEINKNPDSKQVATSTGKVEEIKNPLKNPLVVDAKGQSFDKVTEKAITEARANGNDGVVINNVIDAIDVKNAKPVTTVLVFDKTVKPEVEESTSTSPEPLKIRHFTKIENVDSILSQGFDTSKSPIHGVGGLEGGAKTSKAGNDVLYFTTDDSRWNIAQVFVGEGKGTISRNVFDYDQQKWVEEKNAYRKVDLTPIEAVVKNDAKILVIDSLSKAKKVISEGSATFDQYEVIQQLIDVTKKNKYDILNITNPGGSAWEMQDGSTNKMGDKNWYNTLTGNSGKDDYFVLNKDALTLPSKPVQKTKPVQSNVDANKTIDTQKEVPAHIQAGIESSKKLTESNVRKMVLDYAKSYVVRSKTIEDFKSDYTQGGQTFGKFEGDLKYQKGAVTVELADGRTFSYTASDIYTSNKPKGLTKTSPVTKEVVSTKVIDYLKKSYGKTVETATGPQIIEALEKTEGSIPYTAEIAKKFGKANTISLSDLETRPSLIYGGVTEKVFTDGYFLVLNKDFADKINEKNVAKMRVKRMREMDYNIKREETTFEEASTLVDKEIADAIKNTKNSYPNLDTVIPDRKDIKLLNLKPTVLTIVGTNPTVILEGNGEVAGLNVNYYQYVLNGLPDAKLGYVGDLRPVPFLINGKLEALVMPIRIENPNKYKSKPEVVPPKSINKGRSSSNLGFNPKNLDEPSSPIATKEVDKIIKRSEIAKELSKKLDVPIRMGKFRRPGAIGLFKTQPKVVRYKSGGLPTIFHEVAHFLDSNFDFYKDVPVAERKPLMFEYGHSYDGKPKLQAQEAFAEFMRFVMTGREAEAKGIAPTFYDIYQKRIAELPEIKAVIDTATRDYARWQEQPASAKVLSQISIGKIAGETVTERLSHGIHSLYTDWVDDLHPLSEFTSIAKKLGPLPAEKDPYILARTMRGWVGKADLFLNTGTFDPDNYYSKDTKGSPKMIFTGDSYTSIIKPIAKANALDEFRIYIASERVVNDLGPRGIKSGISVEDAKMAMKEVQDKFPNLNFEELSTARREYKDALLTYMEKKGVIGEEGIKKIKELNKFHVPFYRVMEGLKASGYMGGKKLAGNLGSPLKRIKGNDFLEIVDPLESDVKDTYAFINAAERNGIGVAMANLSKLSPDLGRIFERVDAPMQATKVTDQEIMNAVVKKMELGDMDVPETLQKEMNELLTDVALTVFRPVQDRGTNMLNVNMGDKKLVFQVEEDLFKAIQGLNQEDINVFMKVLAMPAKLLRAGATLSPDFSVRNPIRDTFSATIFSNYGFRPGIDLVKGTFELFTKDKGIYNLWKASGGESSMFVSMDRDKLQKELKDFIATKGEKALNIVKNPIDFLRLISEIGEAATRLGEMRRALNSGASPLTSAFASREVTLDFAKMGAKARGVNMIKAFFSSKINGIDKMVRSFKDNPGRTLFKALMFLTVPSILLYLANRKDPRWKEIPMWQKNTFWIVFTPNNIYRIPKPFELGMLFASVPERTMEFLEEKDPKAFEDISNAVIQGFLPDLMPIPTAGMPLIENLTNYSFFLGRTVVPRGVENLPLEAQSGEYTSEVAKILGKALNYSPSKIDNFVYGYSAGLGRYTVSGIDAILEGTGITHSPTKPAKTLEETPILKAFMVRKPIGTGSESVNRVYDIYAETSKQLNYIKKLAKEGNVDEATAYAKKHPEVVQAPLVTEVISSYSEMNKAIATIRKSDKLSAQEKRDMITKIEELQTQVAQKALDIINGK